MSETFNGMPLVEAPDFDAESDTLGFSAEERDAAISLNRNGFAVIDFPDPEIGARIDRIQASLGPQFGIDFADPEADKTLGERRIQDAWRQDADVHAIAANPDVIALLSKLYGRRAFPFQTLNFPVGTQQEQHCDAVHFSSVPERFMCGIWLAMEDCHLDAGPVFYIAGSHKWPIVNNAMIGRRGYGSELNSAQDPYGAAWNAMVRVYGASREPFLARKGQALIWCANLLHGGLQQLDKRRTRWSQVTHYYFEDCLYYTPAFSDEMLGRMALRNVVDIARGETVPNTYLGEQIQTPRSVAKRTPILKGLGRVFR